MLRTALFAAFCLIPLPAAAQGTLLAFETTAESEQPRTVQTADQMPQGPFPPPPPKGEARDGSLAVFAGPGWLALRDDLGRSSQQATSLAARLGAVIGPEWVFFLGVEHTRTDRGGATFSQTAGMMGVQRFLFNRLYLGGALGLGWVAETGVPDGLTDGPGGTVSAHLGIELLRSKHTALSAEAIFTLGHYSRENWEMGGVRLGLLLF